MIEATDAPEFEGEDVNGRPIWLSLSIEFKQLHRCMIGMASYAPSLLLNLLSLLEREVYVSFLAIPPMSSLVILLGATPYLLHPPFFLFAQVTQSTITYSGHLYAGRDL